MLPSHKARGFLNCLFEVTTDSPPEMQEIVKQSIHIHNLENILAYYEIHDAALVKSIVEDLAHASHVKMEHDCNAHQVGTTSFDLLIRHVAAFAFVAGAALAKNKRV